MTVIAINPFYGKRNPCSSTPNIAMKGEPVMYRGFALYGGAFIYGVIGGVIETMCSSIDGAKRVIDFRIQHGYLNNQKAFDKLPEEVKAKPPTTKT